MRGRQLVLRRLRKRRKRVDWCGGTQLGDVRVPYVRVRGRRVVLFHDCVRRVVQKKEHVRYHGDFSLLRRGIDRSPQLLRSADGEKDLGGTGAPYYRLVRVVHTSL